MTATKTIPTNFGFDVIPVDKLEAVTKRTMTTAKGMDDRIQLVAISAIHATFNNVDYATVLGNILRDFPKGSRVERFAQWVTQNFPMIKIDLAKRKIRIHSFARQDDGNVHEYTDDDWKFADANATPWYTKPEPNGAANVATVEKFLKSLVSLADESSKKERTPELIEFVKKLAALRGFEALAKEYSEAESQAKLDLDAQAEIAKAEAAEKKAA